MNHFHKAFHEKPNYIRTLAWIEKILSSCQTYEQAGTAGKLLHLFHEQYIRNTEIAGRIKDWGRVYKEYLELRESLSQKIAV